ncbi:ABC transporter substrate-binding protein, partial [Escherichia coli]
GNKDISAIGGPASEGLLVTLPNKYDLVPANAPLVAAFKAKGQDSSGPFVWTTYAAVQTLAAGIAKAGEDDPAAVAAAIKATPIETVMGTMSWAPSGDLKGFEFGVFQWHADGTSTQVK